MKVLEKRQEQEPGAGKETGAEKVGAGEESGTKAWQFQLLTWVIIKSAPASTFSLR